MTPPALRTYSERVKGVPSESLFERKRVRWLLGFAAWTAGGFVSASLEYFNGIVVNRPTPYWVTTGWNLVALYLFALTFPIVGTIARRQPVDRNNWRQRTFVYLGWILVLSVIHLVAFCAIYWLLGGPRLSQFAPSERAMAFFRLLFVSNLRTNLIIYGLLFVGVLALNYYRNYLAEERRAAQLREQLAHAQLQALKMQLHPHFLFNTLNAISELITKEPETAERMVIQLSEMLRLSLDSIGLEQVPLKQELEFVERYLAIEQTRFRDRLAVRMDIEADALDVPVPSMLLQPLVENAIRHGIAPLARGGSISISAKRAESRLHLQVRDDGRGLPDPPANGSDRKRLGLANTRARLEQLYGAGGFSFEMRSAPHRGAEVSLSVPVAARA